MLPINELEASIDQLVKIKLAGDKIVSCVIRNTVVMYISYSTCI